MYYDNHVSAVKVANNTVIVVFLQYSPQSSQQCVPCQVQTTDQEEVEWRVNKIRFSEINRWRGS